MHQPPPPAEEEGELLVFTADGKGVPMRRALAETGPASGDEARTESEQEANVLCGSGLLDRPFPRPADDVIDEVRGRAAHDRPKPRHKHVAEMTKS